jgi:dihydroorotate dehydrogenase
MSGEQALAKLDAGADLVQIYSGFIYHGPPLVRDILEAIDKRN